jgi:hypothetical protein
VKRLFYVPLLVLSAAFAILCVRHGTFWPWNVVVHEDGRRTLIQTIFYFEHALGEWPLDVLLAAAIAGAVSAPIPALTLGATRVGAVCLVLDGVIFAGASIEAGPKTALLYLLQFHTRDDVPMVYGSHWRYHLLSQIALMLLPLAVTPVAPKRRINGILIAAWVVFGVLTAIFGISSDSFIDPRYLGHQARELFTHTLVTIPLAMAIFAHGRLGFNLKPALAAAGIGAYLAAGVFLTGAQHHTQSADWSSVICAHFFEHTFSYLVVPAHALLFYRLGARAT